MTNLAHSPFSEPIELPQLSDEAVVQILDFIEQVHALFESRYAAQIWRFDPQQREDRMTQPDGHHADDPPR